MTLKFLIYLSIALTIIVILALTYVIAKWLVALIKNEWSPPVERTYSYEKQIKSWLFLEIVFILISSAVFLETRSFELSFSIFIILLAINLVGTIKVLLWEKHAKDRGAKFKN